MMLKPTKDPVEQKHKLPLQKISKQGWINLAIAATLTFNILLAGYHIFETKICQEAFVDYCAFWSAGRVINESGYADMYDLNKLAVIQWETTPNSSTIHGDLPAMELLYLPIFTIPFKLLSQLNLQLSFFIWNLINLAGLILYLRFFSKKTSQGSSASKPILMLLISLPVLLNFLEGQVNLLLVICLGEFIRAAQLKNPFRAGLWLGGWLLKPQLLVLIIPFLFIQRKFKALAGFTATSSVILALSFGLVGWDGFQKMLGVWMGSGRGGGASNPAAMMNWRMLGVHLASITSSRWGWGVIIFGSILTAALGLFCFRKKISIESTDFMTALLGIFSATCLIAWHAHIHTAIILIPPMLYLMERKRLNEKTISAWVFLPVFIYFMNFGILSLEYFGMPTEIITQITRLLPGLMTFIVITILFYWTIKKFIRSSSRN